MMDFLHPFMQLLISWLLSLEIVIIFYRLMKQSNSKRCSAPKAGGAWPIVGHLHLLLRGKKLPHEIFGAMADKYGPIFTVRLGSREALVINSWEIAKECFTVHDKAFSNRPTTSATKILGYDHAMISFAPYGPYWREMRKISTIEQLSKHRLDMLAKLRGTEVKIAIKELYRLWVKSSDLKEKLLVDMKQWFGDVSLNVIVIMMGGKRCYGNNADIGEEQARRCQKFFRDFLYLLGVFELSDEIPLLGWLDLKGHRKNMKKTAVELDKLMGSWLEEHKQRKIVGSQGKDIRDFMDVLLTIVNDANIGGFRADTVIKATCLNLLIAGGDVIKVALIWILSLLLNNREVLSKVQTELDRVIGRDRLVDESDIKNLVYLQAVVKEALRICPPEPMNGLRTTLEDCTLSSGYFIPAGTRVLVNIHKIQHDERVWPNANEFKPERFLTTNKNTDVRGCNFELIPFGAGRRICPGITLTLQMVHLALATLLHSFEVTKPSNEPVDMTGSPGLSSMKVTPLEVFLAPRLPSKLYK